MTYGNKVYIAKIAQIKTREVIVKNEIVGLNLLFLNLSNIFKVYLQSLAKNVSWDCNVEQGYEIRQKYFTHVTEKFSYFA